ncbi:D-alanyl-D-alanine carboxypeptidase family protein [Sporolactobacillus spathodeae]|uniref:serine-type D-Ala-D-Ala carboxypeptidase n=1 Tax=Sporolactobacillus spathodeae TaxID=1465502 RepID=A0ABS2Q4R0_9BACL|nr:D-alanyl-D-alanine carboxypeptidase family protein [Sporolactobacillus spathodeae]MBM7656774.1 D-alanyl-D-alanine carboxypeptidase (penicillin-binding protein 5/6) [Sporolactobacillus spathodeae]
MNFKKRLRHLAAFGLIFTLALAVSFQAPFAKNAEAANTLGLKAKSAILVDFNSGKVLYEKNADQVYPPASMTKMMTEYLVMQALNQKRLTWNTKVSISDYAYTISQNRSFSNVPLRKDYQYTVRDLYEAMAIYSANGATIALAEKVGGTEKHFVDMMNQTAKKLGMTTAHYINSSGLDNVDLGKYAPYGSKNDSNELAARDLAKLAYHVIKDYPEALQISKIPLKNFTAGVKTPIQMVNWDYMLPGFGADMAKFTYPGVDGLKTGHTDLAGYCFTGTVNRDGHRLVSVVMGTTSDSQRFEQTRALFDFGYQTYSLKTIAKKGQKLKDQKTVAVHNGKQSSVGLAFGQPVKTTVTNGEKVHATYKVVLDHSKLNKDGSIEAPVKKGEKIGYAVLKTSNGAYGSLYPNIDKVPVVAADQVDKNNWFVRMFQAIGGLFSGLFHWIAGLF